MGVCVLMGSKSDLEKASKSFEIFRRFDVDFEVHVASAHRTPELVEKIVKETEHDVFLVFAGLSAALPGFVAALTTKPVVGVPLSGKVPYDSLLSMVQMPKGVPVAVVGVDNVVNGALLCVQILSIKDNALMEKIKEYRNEMKEKVYRDNREVENNV